MTTRETQRSSSALRLAEQISSIWRRNRQIPLKQIVQDYPDCSGDKSLQSEILGILGTRGNKSPVRRINKARRSQEHQESMRALADFLRSKEARAEAYHLAFQRRDHLLADP